jgi:hypothetical protein
LAIGGPTGPAGGAPDATGGVPASPLGPGNAAAGAWLNAGAAEVQLWGTDNTPSDAARPALAVTAASPSPDEPKAPAPELTPLLSVEPNAPNPLPKALVAEPNELISEPAEPSAETPDVTSDADDVVPDSRLAADVAAVDDELRVVKDDSGDVEDEVEVAADASPGITALDSGADSIELIGDTTCAPVPAEVPTACVTAALSPANPAGSVVSSGVVNDDNVDAAEDAAEYPYIAVASCAHISVYSASVAIIAGVF